MLTTHPQSPLPDRAEPSAPSMDRPDDERVNWASAIPFFVSHAVLGLVVFTGVSRTAVYLFVAMYAVRCFAITAGYHRYFSHRSYRLSRPVQFVMALIGITAAQKGPLWWAAHHRRHHRYADTPDDVHSPQRGFWWSHVGWILADRYKKTDTAAVRDLAAYPELRFLDRHHDLGPWLLGAAAFLIGGWSGLIVGFFGSTVVLWHVTFTINSLSHTVGTRRYATPDTSRNNVVLALLTFGEGWHNNHHHHQASARQGFFWWEIDLSWYGLRAMEKLGLARELRQPSPDVLVRNRIDDGAFDVGMFRARYRRLAAGVGAPDMSAVPSSDADGPSSMAAPARHERQAELHQALSTVRDAAEELAAVDRPTAAARRHAGTNRAGWDPESPTPIDPSEDCSTPRDRSRT